MQIAARRLPHRRRQRLRRRHSKFSHGRRKCLRSDLQIISLAMEPPAPKAQTSITSLQTRPAPAGLTEKVFAERFANYFASYGAACAKGANVNNFLTDQTCASRSDRSEERRA